ncbi:hypothetical protein CVS40_1792 [Lucilia cuprina]|nr:hypothetical protein CVS40_1792 [Lucilia cuprina]
MFNDDDTNNRKQQKQQHPKQNPLTPLFPIPTTAGNTNNNNKNQNDLPKVDDTAASDTKSEQNIHNSNQTHNTRYFSPTISALVRGLHDTGVRDVHTLQLPLFETDDEEEDEGNEKGSQKEKQNNDTEEQLQKEDTLKTKSHLVKNFLHHTISPNTLTNSSPKKTKSTSELSPTQDHEHQPPSHHQHHHLFHLHPSLPRFVVDLAGDPADNNNGDTEHKLLESHAPPSPGGARRLSQFNFNLRRFSHTHHTTPIVSSGHLTI